MKIIITEEQRKSVNEMIKLNIKVGDTLMGGKFKNKKVVVKTIGKNDKGYITINGKPLLRFRILKEDDSTDRMVKIFKQWLYSNYDEIAFLETKTYDGLPLIVVHYTTESNVGNYDTWLAMDIMDNWNKFTSDTIPVMVRWSNRISSDTKILIDVEEYDEDDTINEGVDEYPILKRYWNKLIENGDEPRLDDFNLTSFGFDMSEPNEELQKHLVDYLGYDNAIEKSKELIQEFGHGEIDLGNFNTKNWRVTNIDEIDEETIKVEVTIYGDDIYEIIEDMDMTEFWDFKEYLNEIIEGTLYVKITLKTGLNIVIVGHRYEDEK